MSKVDISEVGSGDQLHRDTEGRDALSVPVDIAEVGTVDQLDREARE